MDKFQAEVIERLAKIETEVYNLKSTNKSLTGAIITIGTGVIIALIKNMVGI